MTTHILTTLVVIILMLAPRAFADPTEDRYLSDTDPGYRIIEILQKSRCEKAPTHDCQVTAEQCEADSRMLWKQMFQEEPPSEVIEQQCKRVSTRYEFPGVYRLLSEMYDEVASAAIAAGLKEIQKPSLGSLPVREVNVRVAAVPDIDHAIILFNIRFFEFANEMAKIVALTIPFSEEADKFVIDTREEAFHSTIAESPMLLVSFVETILTFLEVHQRQAIIPESTIHPILRVYQHGTESFALAHEYAHIAYGHSGLTASLESSDLSSSTLGVGAEGASGDWFQEFQADIAAARIIRAVWEKKVTEKDSHMMWWALTETPEFYFIVREIIEDSRSILSSGRPLDGPSQTERVLLNVAQECTVRQSCDLRSALQEHLDQLENPNSHPHPRIRREMMSHLLVREPANEVDGAMLAISGLMSRNATLLWDQIRPILMENWQELSIPEN